MEITSPEIYWKSQLKVLENLGIMEIAMLPSCGEVEFLKLQQAQEISPTPEEISHSQDTEFQSAWKSFLEAGVKPSWDFLFKNASCWFCL
jgi:hypothetical protein